MLRLSLAKLLHKLPSEIDGMDVEDAYALAVHCELEREQLKRDTPPAGRNTRTEVVKEVHLGTRQSSARRR
jgi:hypothetical protein